MNQLAQRHCLALDGQAPMTAAEIQSHLALLQGWALDGDAIIKRYTFSDFHRTMGFANAIAYLANREDHHPDLQLSYGSCTVRWNTHSVGGLSINDFICAAQVDALLP